MSIGNYIQTADFKSEKHVPVIEGAEKITAGVVTAITVSVGKEIAHPNTTEHFISYIELYFKADDGKFMTCVGKAEFGAHGESAAGANQGAVHTEPVATFHVNITTPGTLIAVSYCNIHGLWESVAKVAL